MARVLMLDGPRSLRLVDVPIPDPGPRDIVVEHWLSAISHGTELSLYRGSSPFHLKHFDRGLRAFVDSDEDTASSYPHTLGYEAVGKVTAVGTAVTEFHVGDVVHTCAPHQDHALINLDAAMRNGFPPVLLPTAERPERALFLSLAAVALLAVHDANINLGDRVAVIGLGTIGLLASHFALKSGASKVIAIDPLEDRRLMALAFGVDEALGDDQVDAHTLRRLADGHGCDVAIEFSGKHSGLQTAIRAVRQTGRIVSGGFLQDSPTALNLAEEWHHNRLDMVATQGAWSNPHRNYPRWDGMRIMEAAVDLLYSPDLDLTPLIGNRVPFAQAATAFRELDEAVSPPPKVILTYDGVA